MTKASLKILFPINEAYPLYKIGGLGDVGGSLPKTLNTFDNIDIRLALPKHPEISLDTQPWVVTDTFTVPYDNKLLKVTVYLGYLPNTNIPVYLFAEDTYISQHTDASDNHADKYAVFSLIVSHWAARSGSWRPHLIHAHDWHTALISPLLKHRYPSSNIKTLITIHNLAYQGDTQTPVAHKLGLKPEECQVLSWDQTDHHLNIMLEGLIHADFINTVSPHYAQEILTPEYGEDIHETLKTLSHKLMGILNGLDYQEFNPETDPHLTTRYNVKTFQKAKAENRRHLQQELGLPQKDDVLFIGFVGRVDAHQKGIQLIIQAINAGAFDEPNLQFAFLGTGDPNLEKELHQATANKDHISVTTRYDEPLARKIYASSDLMPIPSKYEPCGLVQLIAMRYGCLPVARNTGGLSDTISHKENGFLFDNYTSNDLMQALENAINTLQNGKERINMQKKAMDTLYMWDDSAKKYATLYQELLLN